MRRSLEGKGTPLQYSCLENPMDGGAWWAAVHGVAKSRARLSDFTCTFHFHALEKAMATHSSVLAWRIQGTGSLVGCCLWGRTESDTTEVTQQQQRSSFVSQNIPCSFSLSCSIFLKCLPSFSTFKNQIKNSCLFFEAQFKYYLIILVHRHNLHPIMLEMVNYMTVLAWRIPWTEEPGGLQSMGSQRVRRD